MQQLFIIGFVLDFTETVLSSVHAECGVGPVHVCRSSGSGTVHPRLRAFVEAHELVLKVLIARCVGW